MNLGGIILMNNKSKKCVLILPYFGKFNNYFQLFLKSCEKNPTYDWMIFTDSTDEYNYPNNVHVIPMTLQEMKKIAEKKLGFSIRLETPYKLCDYKPTYGFLFEEYIKEYEYWGHCDCDLIFGNLEKILTPLLNQNYDKLFAAGHLTVYKNTKENIRRFMNVYKGKLIYKEAFTTDKIYVFDEDFRDDNNVHSIFMDENLKIYHDDLSMNPTIYSAKYIRAKYSLEHRTFVNDPYIKARYYWNNGNIIGLEVIDNEIVSKEYLYMHLQMRKMRLKKEILSSNRFQFLPDRFQIVNEIPRTKKELNLATIKCSYLYWIDVYIKKIKGKIKEIVLKNENFD